MYEIHAKLSKENILRLVSEYDIFKAYCPNFIQVGKSFSSPFRLDKNPSCRISMYNKLLFRDFSETETYDCFSFVQRVLNSSFFEALIHINITFNLGLKCVNNDYHFPEHAVVESSIKKTSFERNQTIIKIHARPFNILDKEYWWDRYHISSKTLIESNTFPIDRWFIQNNKTNGLLISNKTDSLCYAYYFYNHDGLDLYKIYSPNRDAKNGKWISNVDYTVIDGVDEIEKNGSLLIITKSRKDRLLLKEMGYNAVAVNNEGSFLPEINVNKFKNRYDNVLIYFDNDAPGISNAKKYSERYSLKYICNNQDHPKDISGIQEEWRDFDFSKKYISNLINGQ